ncbi:LysR substrate-binding domain-containing protein [Dactylosporangium sp. AC04546]|uniref:LysR family transcriptional regulator n=1 Tax=Dactylosporangium sp. AC04546 TaxID=2862460 RepID=UPI001EE152D3|nr:LysR family transcriptional regulator [Dactylosporangium sp. AC04546]WVK86542.1 LysR substrate-binding domain-containing protein [Dactylosporangium sp. AC04546]
MLRAIAAHGSIAAAARELGYTRSAISQQMSALERSAGATLLIRGGKTVTVTPLGRRLLDHTERILVELRAAEAVLRQATGEVAGSLTIGIAFREGPAIMSTALTQVRHRYPRLELTLAAVTETECADDLRQGRLDVAIVSRFARTTPPPVPGLREWVLGTDPLLLCTPAGHRLAGRDRCSPNELETEGWVMCQNNSLGPLSIGLCAEAGFRPHVNASVHDVATALGLVGAGWGITLAPELTPAASAGRITRLPIEGMHTRRYSILAVRAGDENVPEVSVVVKAVHKAVAESPFTWSRTGAQVAPPVAPAS